MMKKVWFLFCVILVSCLVILLVMLFILSRKTENLQKNYEKLYKQISESILLSAPLADEESETYQHNMKMLDSFFGYESICSEVIANQCFVLKRQSKMECSKIERIVKYETPGTIELIMQDGEHYWFYMNGDSITGILKGANGEDTLFAVLE